MIGPVATVPVGNLQRAQIRGSTVSEKNTENVAPSNWPVANVGFSLIYVRCSAGSGRMGTERVGLLVANSGERQDKLAKDRG